MNTIPEIDNDWMEEILKATSEDLTLTKLIKKIREGWPKYLHDLKDDLKVYHKFKNELRTENGLILKGNQIVIPTKLRRNIIRKIHTNHNGIEATIKLAKETPKSVIEACKENFSRHGIPKRICTDNGTNKPVRKTSVDMGYQREYVPITEQTWSIKI
ncbi:hypothetical protein QE152_g35600 [Popillia japonica]|uniref:Transposase n=1 Tax=Popillia japonica TaxID=7064 RepID=A0AAW1IFZ5_POPJA